ncbi:MAG TPA: molybdate ABC transporter substrate-binding protein [Acidobacteria bacterium]|nr:molybdate ABC transporter substrate-binding protein [Acidobacteriota bacterium]
MVTSVRSLSLLLIVGFGLPSCSGPVGQPGSSSTATVVVSVAASLSDAVGDVANVFEKQTGIQVLVNAAGSQILATQIIEEIPVDVFVSADERQMTRTIARGKMDQGSYLQLLSNQLVVVVPSDRLMGISRPDDLIAQSVRRIALGDPEAVPGGVYAREYLDKEGVWDALKSKVVPTRNVRAALRAVEAGTVDAGVVYRTDARQSVDAVIAFDVPVGRGPRIIYPAAVSTEPPNPESAVQFFSFLQTAKAQQIFEAYGFISLLAH